MRAWLHVHVHVCFTPVQGPVSEAALEQSHMSQTPDIRILIPAAVCLAET